MSEYEFEIHLQQHTPILHFQGSYADTGATLRATELKPKLDSYIKANYEIKPEWKIGEPEALNYKLKIVSGEGQTASCASLPMYFAEQKKRPTDADYSKKPIVAKQDNEKERQYSTSLVFFCLDKGLLNVLKHLDYTSFFLVTNFGTRQSKGYGSFFRDQCSIDKDNQCGLIINGGYNQQYRVDTYFTLNGGKNDWNKVMTHIGNVYKCLRGGINENSLYFKSLMFSYARSKKIEGNMVRWDKRMIKEKFYPIIMNDQKDGNTEKDKALQEWTKLRMNGKIIPLKSHPNCDALQPADNAQPIYMFRDYLGLSTSETWKIPYNKTINKISKTIVRFKSPILFKPIWDNESKQWVVFLLHRNIPSQFKHAKFEIIARTNKYKGGEDDIAPYYKEYGQKREREEMIPFPRFSMDDYLNFVFDKNILYTNNFANPHYQEAIDIIADLEDLRRHFKPIKAISL